MRLQDLTGQRFGRLVVVALYPHKRPGTCRHWVCRCNCGRYLLVRTDNLKAGHSTQCSVCCGDYGIGSVFVKKGVNDNEWIIQGIHRN